MKVKNSFLLAVSVVFLLVGCAKKSETSEFNKSALYWYQNINKNIAQYSIDKADENYLSLKSEHTGSPLIATASLLLANAHMKNEKYLLARYYFDEYAKIFPNGKRREYAEFMKLKASFLGIKDVYKDQKLIMDSIQNANAYLVQYSKSSYAPLVNSILIRLHMAQYLLNENIASLYDRTGKKRAAEIYRDKNSGSIVEMTDIKPPEKGIMGKIFD